MFSKVGQMLKSMGGGIGSFATNSWTIIKNAVSGDSSAERWLPERPPALEEVRDYLGGQGDTVSQDWRWLSLRCERRLNEVMAKNSKQKRSHLPEQLGKSFDITQFSCFVPRTVLEAVADKRIRYTDDFEIKIEEFTAAVMFCDASGFTALTEALDQLPNGAERLGNIINDYFDKMIKIIRYWGGDIIKFSGDALTVVWPVDDETEGDEEANEEVNEDDDEYQIDARKACKLAVQCCMDLHSMLHDWPTGFKDRTLALHIGVGFGKVTILQVGGIMDRWEYVVAGAPLEQIAIAEPLAGTGETVISPSVISSLEDCVILEAVESPSEGQEGYFKTKGLKDGPMKPPPPLAPIQIEDDDVDLLRRYIPPAVFRRLTSGCNVFLNELRRISVLFICARGLDVSTPTGSHTAHRLMKMTQKAAYTMEGSVNKFLVDDKGVLLLVMFGLPPVYHLDDPVRAVMAGLRVIDGMKVLGLNAAIGITSGRVWCGTVGNDFRKEYTALGDYVNLSARLMAKAGKRQILVDSTTYNGAKHVMEFKQLPSIKVKGKEVLIDVFIPTGVMKTTAVMDMKKTEMPLLMWPKWKSKRKMKKILLPGHKYKTPKLPDHRPPPDYDVPCGPLFVHEWYEPYLPELQPTVEIGGVIVIRGKEGLGAFELAKLLLEIGEKDLGRQCFLLSNMPDSPHMNIGNVPLLAWRKLCTEMVERWRVADNREKKGFSKIDRDNSVYGLTKELIHPSFHWRLADMKQVIHGLTLPSELPENQNLAKMRKDYMRGNRQKEKSTNPLKFMKAIIQTPVHWTGVGGGDQSSNVRDSDDDDGSDDDSEFEDEMETLRMGQRQATGESIAPIIGSLVNGFTLYENSIIILHVRTGTSVFAEMDKDSWKVARIVARVAMVRRLRKMDIDMKDVKDWRRLHSRKCLWCKGYKDDIKDIRGRTISIQPTSMCRPVPSFYKPLIFVLICGDTTDNVPEQEQLIHMAKDCKAYIELKKLTVSETASFLSHCFQLRKQAIPQHLVNYIHRVSAGIPKYAHLTMKMLFEENHVSLVPADPDDFEDSTSETSIISESPDASSSDDENTDSASENELDRGAANDRPVINDKTKTHDKNTTDINGSGTVGTTDNAKNETIDQNTSGRSLLTSKWQLWRGFQRYNWIDEANLPPRPGLFGDDEDHLMIQDGWNQVNNVSYDEKPSNSYVAHRYRQHFGQLSMFSTRMKKDLSRLLQKKIQSDERRIKKGNLTEAEARLLQNPPHWLHVEERDNQALELYKKRKEAEEKGFEWDSDTGKAVEVPDAEEKRFKKVKVNADLRMLPFVPELIATCMFTVERLQPEEQMVAKVASVFPCSFTADEIQSAYPRITKKSGFRMLIEALIVKGVLEQCPPPTVEELQELAFTMAINTKNFRGPNYGAGASTRSNAKEAKKERGLKGGADGGKERSTPNPKVVVEDVSEGQGNLENTCFPGFSKRHHFRPSVMAAGGLITASGEIVAGVESGAQSGALSGAQDGGQSGVEGGAGASTPKSRAAESKTDTGGSLKNEDAKDTDRGKNSNKQYKIILPSRAPSDVKNTSSQDEQSSNPDVDEFQEEQNYLRFTSIALQHVVADLLLTDERKWLTLVSRRTISLRFADPTGAVPLEAQSKNQLAREERETAPEEDFKESIPQSLIDAALAAAVETKASSGRDGLLTVPEAGAHPAETAEDAGLPTPEAAQDPPQEEAEGIGEESELTSHTPSSGLTPVPEGGDTAHVSGGAKSDDGST